ncbi:hypothetical protein ABIB56_003139 [Glaciihabitans sp. UYNi722]
MQPGTAGQMTGPTRCTPTPPPSRRTASTRKRMPGRDPGSQHRHESCSTRPMATSTCWTGTGSDGWNYEPRHQDASPTRTTIRSLPFFQLTSRTGPSDPDGRGSPAYASPLLFRSAGFRDIRAGNREHRQTPQLPGPPPVQKSLPKSNGRNVNGEVFYERRSRILWEANQKRFRDRSSDDRACLARHRT